MKFIIVIIPYFPVIDDASTLPMTLSDLEGLLMRYCDLSLLYSGRAPSWTFVIRVFCLFVCSSQNGIVPKRLNIPRYPEILVYLSKSPNFPTQRVYLYRVSTLVVTWPQRNLSMTRVVVSAVNEHALLQHPVRQQAVVNVCHLLLLINFRVGL